MPSRNIESAKRWLAILKMTESPDAHDPENPETEEQKEHRKLSVQFALAGELVSNLEAIRPQPVYDRPAGVPSDDIELWQTMEIVKKRGGRAGVDDRRAASDAAEWLNELFTAEMKSAATLGTLCRAVETFEMIGGSVATADAEKIRQHVLHHWGCDVYECPQGDKRKQDSWCKAQCRQEDIAPTWLISRDRPPDYISPLSDSVRPGDDWGEDD